MSLRNSLGGTSARPGPSVTASSGNGGARSMFSQPLKPSIPNAKDSFEPQLKVILRLRLVKVFGLCLAVSLVASALSTGYAQHDWMSWCISVLLKASLWFLAGMAPTISGRKLWVKAYTRPEITPSFKSHVRATFKDPQTVAAITVYTASSLSLLSYSVPPIFASTRRYPYSINPDLVLCIFVSISIAVWQAWRESLRIRFVVQWSKFASLGNIPDGLRKTLLPNFIAAIISALVHLPIFLVLYHLLLPVILRFASYLPLHHFLRSLNRSVASVFPYPVSVPILIFKTSWKNAANLTLTSIRNSLIWETANTLVDVYLAHPPLQLGSDEKTVLSAIAGLSSQNEYFSQHAYSFLRHVIKTSDAARKVIYSDLKYMPSLWSTVFQVTLGENGLGGNKENLVRRGAPLPPPAAKPEAPKPSIPVPGTPLKLQHESIFKPMITSPTQRLVNEALSSDGSASRIVGNASGHLARIPNLFLAQLKTGEVGQAQQSAPNPETLEVKGTGIAERIVGFGKAKWQRLISTPECVKKSGLEAYWAGERRDRVVRTWVRKVERDLCAIEILQYLVMHSLVEDSLGTVQRDIPKVLEALSTYLTVVEEAREDLLSTLKSDDTPKKREEMVKAIQTLEPLQSALTEAIQGIVAIFQEKLSVFGFAPKTARRLQMIADQL